MLSYSCRRTAKAQYRDQKVCCLILSLMTHAARYLGQRMGDDSKLLECRDIMMHLLSIFWFVFFSFMFEVYLDFDADLLPFNIEQ